MGPMVKNKKGLSSGLTREFQFRAAVRYLTGNALAGEGIVW